MKLLQLELFVIDDGVQLILHISTDVIISKGKKCSIQGRRYEKTISDLCKSFKSMHIDIPFNTQTDDELGGCSAGHDIMLNFNKDKDIAVEAKRVTPDWMQLSIEPDKNGIWKSTVKSKIPLESQQIFEFFLKNMDMFEKPPFLEKTINYEEWIKIKHLYKDRYISVPNDTISRVYFAKGVHYIQLNGYGLYHTGTNPCNFNVPFFACEQRLRVRCKRHGKKDANGNHLPSSVMASFCPKLKTLSKSIYSLDDVRKIPNGIIPLT